MFPAFKKIRGVSKTANGERGHRCQTLALAGAGINREQTEWQRIHYLFGAGHFSAMGISQTGSFLGWDWK